MSWGSDKVIHVATIVSSRKEGDDVTMVIKTAYEEFLQLSGHMEHIRLFSEEQALTQTNISQRGKGSRTKYFLIPKTLRKNFDFNNRVSCMRIDNDEQVMFIYLVNKSVRTPSRRALIIEKYEYPETA